MLWPKSYKSKLADHLLTWQFSTVEHLKPPSPVQGSLKEIYTLTLGAFVNDVAAEMYAVGWTVSA